MNQKQIDIAARLMAVLLLWEATDHPDRFFPGLFEERAEGRFTIEEESFIVDAMTDLAQDLLRGDIRFNNVGDIINYAKRS